MKRNTTSRILGVVLIVSVATGFAILSCKDHGIPFIPETGACGNTALQAGPSGITYANFVDTLFRNNCGGLTCHSGQGQRSFSIETFCDIVRGGISGPGIVPGQPNNSVAYQVLFSSNGIVTRMPDGLTPLPQSTLDSLATWIHEGAPEGVVDSGGAGGDTCAVSFENYIGPLFAANCGGASCHSNGAQNGGFSVESYASVVQGGFSGPGVVKFEPDSSTVYKVLFAGNGITPGTMPKSATSFEQPRLDSIRDWILNGALEFDSCNTAPIEPAPLTYDDYVRPQLMLNCSGASCHTGASPEHGFSVDTYQGLRDGGELGPGVVPYDTALSIMYRALSPDNGIIDRMPPSPASAVRSALHDSLALWIMQGAPQHQ